MNGYHSDKTQIYYFGAKPPAGLLDIHRACIKIQSEIASQLRPGAVPSEIYHNIMSKLPEEFKQNFMGFGGRVAKFLGHGIGLQVDEPPVIAGGFTSPLKENTAIAIEPKKGYRNRHGRGRGHLFCNRKRREMHNGRRVRHNRGIKTNVPVNQGFSNENPWFLYASLYIAAFLLFLRLSISASSWAILSERRFISSFTKSGVLWSSSFS